MSNSGVHRTHCCAIHGCKYRDDDCPVVTGEIEQDYLCEDCNLDGIRSIKELKWRLRMRGTELEERILAIAWGLRGIDMMDHYDNPEYDRMLNYLNSILDTLYADYKE